MRKTTLVALVACAALAVSGGLGRAHPSTGFSLKSLQGTYAATFQGAFDATGVVSADGAGNITGGTETVNDGTNICVGTLTGTYTVNSDGTGTLTLSFTTTHTNFGACPTSPTTNSAAFVTVSPDKIEVSGTDTGVLVSGSLTRQVEPFQFGH